MDNLDVCCCCLSSVDAFRHLSNVGVLCHRKNSTSFGLGLISGAVFDLNLNEDHRFLPATVAAFLGLMVVALSFCLCCPGDFLTSLSSALAELASQFNTSSSEAGIIEEPSTNSKPFSMDEELLNTPMVIPALTPSPGSSASRCFGGASIEELLCSDCSLVSDKLNGNELVTSMLGGTRDESMGPTFSTSTSARGARVELKFSAPSVAASSGTPVAREDGEGDTRRLF